ncbi:MAG: endoribonuclease [Actinomycetia bacterium]|nr:endoribonuclease [Actinomycetes bacterium]
MRNAVNVPGVARIPVWSHAIVAGPLVFVSGTCGTVDESLAIVDGGMGAQTAQILQNFETILAGCGASLEAIVRVDVFITDVARFGEMNAVYQETFGLDTPPTRTTVECSALAVPDAIVEMNCIAYRPE